jgi:hypothetical protein
MAKIKVEEIKISDKQVIAEIKAIQTYIESKGEKAIHTEIIHACIRLAKRLSAEDWGVYLEVKYTHELEKEKRE